MDYKKKEEAELKLGKKAYMKHEMAEYKAGKAKLAGKKSFNNKRSNSR